MKIELHEVATPRPPREVVIYMDEFEAVTLRTLLAHVGWNGQRKHAVALNSLWENLIKLFPNAHTDFVSLDNIEVKS